MPSTTKSNNMVPSLSGNMMNVEAIGGVSLYRPRLESEQLARSEAENNLRGGYPSGKYTDPRKINEILQFQFAHFYTLLHSELPKIASRNLMEFLLGQYDLAARIELKRRKSELTNHESSFWGKRGPIIRRSLKHLAELVITHTPSEVSNLQSTASLLNLDTVVICCEQLIELYTLSDQTHGVHPNETTLTIPPEGRPDYLILEVNGFERFSNHKSRIEQDNIRQRDYLEETSPHFDLDFQATELDTAFQSEFGFGYKDAIQGMMHLIDTAMVPDDQAFDVPFVSRDAIIDALSKGRGWSHVSIERLLNGFTLNKEAAEGRVLHKPKQEYRALRRGLFEMNHETGPHLVWSRCMARECLLELMKGTVFQRCPHEWKSAGINGALATLQRKCGNWFEEKVGGNMAAIGACGKASIKDGIGVGADRVTIPPGIGEIDYLGFFPSEGLLTLLEDKMVDDGFEPTYFRDDISSFVSGKKPYSAQLRRKVDWVRHNLLAVCKGLSSLLPGKPQIDATRVAGALITLHPTYATYFIPDYPCVSLSELMDSYKASGKWPYSSGVSEVS